MTSPLAVIALSYAGTDLQLTANGIFIEIARGLMDPPRVRGEDVVVPYLAGRSARARENDVLPIELRGFVMASSGSLTQATQRTSYQANWRSLRTLFATNRARANLVATLPSGTVATISALPMNTIWDEAITGELGTLSIELEGFADWVFV